MLKYRTVAPQDSPVFRILDSEFEFCDYRLSQEEMRSKMAIVFPIIAPKLQQEFRKGACPTNLDEEGNGILYVCVYTVCLPTN